MKEVKKATTNQILDAVKQGFDLVDKRFDKMEGRMDKMEGRVTKIETNMVTKNYLDEKFADLRGDLVLLTRKEDKKVIRLVGVLRQRKVISSQEADEIMAMEPFPELGLRLKNRA